MSHRFPLALASLLVMLAACGPKPAPQAPVTPKAVKHSPAVSGETVGGTVFAPRDTKAGAYALLMRADLPVAGAPIALVDTGTTATVTQKGKSGSNGKYSIDGLPVDKVVRVRAIVTTPGGSTASLETIAKAGQSFDADIDIASTMLALTLVAHAKGGTIAYDPLDFAKAVTALQGELEGQGGQPDPTKPDALVTQTEFLAHSIKAINAVVGGPFGDAGASPAGTTSASPSPGSSPDTSPSPTPSTAASGVSPSPSASPSTGASTSPVPSGSPSPTPPASPTPGAPETFAASLAGANEVPKVTTSGTASVTISLAADRRSLTLSGSASGLSGAITGGQIQLGPLGTGAQNVHAILVSGTTLSATWSVGDGVPLTVDAINNLEAGKLFVNLFTAAHPQGEVAGVLTRQL